MEDNKKISLPIAILFVFMAFFVGLLETLTAITGFGIIVSEFINGAYTFVVDLILFVSGVKSLASFGIFNGGSAADAVSGDVFGVILKPVFAFWTIFLVNKGNEIPGLDKIAKVAKK